MKILHMLNKLDSLENIAKIYNVSINSLLELNNLSTDSPLPKTLLIPNENSDFVVVNNLKRNFLFYKTNTCNFENVKNEFLLLGFEAEGEEDMVLFKKKQGNIYVVGVTETLDLICKKFNLKKEDVMLNNNLKSEKLFIGQMLKL